MDKLAVFLRGVNVNGIHIKMDELKDVLESLSYKNVITVLATGNVIATTMEKQVPYESHKSIIEEGIGSYFKYDCNVILKTPKEIHDIINETSGHTVPEAYHHYIFLSNDDSVGNRLTTLFYNCNRVDKEQFIVGDYGMYWIVPKGSTLKSDFGSKVLGKKEFKNLLTSRTINTLEKMSKYL